MATWQKLNKILTAIFAGNAPDFDGDTMKVALVTVAPTLTDAGDEFLSDMSLCTVGGNYAPITLTCTDALSGGTWTLSSSTSITWAQHASNPNDAVGAIFYKDTGTPLTSQVVQYLPFGTTIDLTAGDLTITPTSNELLSVS